MKNLIIIALMLVVVNPSKSESGDTLNAEKEAIRQVIVKEREAFYNADLEGEANAWRHQPYVVKMGTSGKRIVSWDSLYHFFKNTFNDSSFSMQNLNLDIHDDEIIVQGNQALAMHNVNVQFDIDWWKDYQMKNWIVTYLEKDKKEWKIIFQMRGRQKENQHFSDLEDEINQLGHKLLSMGKVDESIKMFQLNVDYFPESFNVYDSLADAYMKNNDKENAIINYQKSLELNPENKNAIDNLEKLRQ